MSSFPLTNSIIFQDGEIAPATRKGIFCVSKEDQPKWRMYGELSWYSQYSPVSKVGNRWIFQPTFNLAISSLFKKGFSPRDNETIYMVVDPRNFGQVPLVGGDWNHGIS